MGEIQGLKTWSARLSTWRLPDQLDIPAAARYGTHVYTGSVFPFDAKGHLVGPGDIEAQTHAVFQNMRETLADMGCQMKDLVRLNTYYVYSGEEQDATRYWESMTRVRLQYFPDPGPAATAVRVAGHPYDGVLIQIEAEAISHDDPCLRLRIMPAESWDWSIPVPLSQGWRIGDQVWVGGQISADRSGKAVDLGDARAQTRNVLAHIANVLRDAGGSLDDLIHLKICYRHDGDDAAAEEHLRTILQAVKERHGLEATAVTAFGVKLVYEGLLLEIDATAMISGGEARTATGPNANWAAKIQAAARPKLAYVSGQVAPAGRAPDLAAQVSVEMEQVLAAVQGTGLGKESVRKLHVFFTPDSVESRPERLLPEVHKAAAAIWGSNCPAVTAVCMVGVPGRKGGIEIDAIAG